MYEKMKKIITSLYNFFTPAVSTEYAIRNNLKYLGISEDSEWLYYWEGELGGKGREVKVSTQEQREFFKRERK